MLSASIMPTAVVAEPCTSLVKLTFGSLAFYNTGSQGLGGQQGEQTPLCLCQCLCCS